MRHLRELRFVVPSTITVDQVLVTQGLTWGFTSYQEIWGVQPHRLFDALPLKALANNDGPADLNPPLHFFLLLPSFDSLVQFVRIRVYSDSMNALASWKFSKLSTCVSILLLSGSR